MTTKYRILIPAAGRSSRSGLSYPKSLYRLEGVPIIVRVCRLFESYTNNPVLVIINPDHQQLFSDVFKEYSINAEFVFQREARGMGHAILQANEYIKDSEEVIAVWSDIPMIKQETVDILLACHYVFRNDFSLVTALSDDCYTIVEREQGRLVKVIETKSEGIPPGKYGERDIGLFVFKKGPVFSNLLTLQKGWADTNAELSFLGVIAKLVKEGYRADGYPVAAKSDLLSFNTPADLELIENTIKESGSTVNS